MEKNSEKQIGGSHYAGLKIGVFHFARANRLSGLVYNLVKYAVRYDVLGLPKDLRKLRHFAEMELDALGEPLEEPENEPSVKAKGNAVRVGTGAAGDGQRSGVKASVGQ